MHEPCAPNRPTRLSFPGPRGGDPSRPSRRHPSAGRVSGRHQRRTSKKTAANLPSSHPPLPVGSATPALPQRRSAFASASRLLQISRPSGQHRLPSRYPRLPSPTSRVRAIPAFENDPASCPPKSSSSPIPPASWSTTGFPEDSVVIASTQRGNRPSGAAANRVVPRASVTGIVKRPNAFDQIRVLPFP
jgi:hypothetical protein